MNSGQNNQAGKMKVFRKFTRNDTEVNIQLQSGPHPVNQSEKPKPLHLKGNAEKNRKNDRRETR